MDQEVNNIKSIELKNFRCYKQLKLNMGKCHALIGENGAGKTAILEAINLATSPNYVASRINEQDFNIDDEDNISIEIEFNHTFINKVPDGYAKQNIPCNKVRLEIKRREKAAPGRSLCEPFVIEHYAIPAVYTSSQKPSIEGIPDYVEQTANGYQSLRKSREIFKFTKLHLTLQNELDRFPAIFYFDRNRVKESCTGFNTLFQRVVKDLNWRYRKSWDQNASLNYWNNYYDSVINNISDSNLSKLISGVKSKLEELTGNSYSSLEISLINIEQPFMQGFLALRNQTNQIEVDNIGSGISILLSFLLLEAMAKISKEDIILLIDEPELHLHPQLQQSIFEHFEKAQHQIIYTTQSDCFLDLKRWQSITRVSHVHDCFPNVEKLNQVFDGKTLSQHITDIGEYDLHRKIFYREQNQIFFARKCLLVEGPNDKYGIPILAEKLEVLLTEVTIIMCNGKSIIKHYEVLCLAFDIPFFVVFDEDNYKSFSSSEKANNDSENRRIKELSNNNFYSFASSFEDLLAVKKRAFLRELELMRASDLPDKVIECVQAIKNWSSQ